MGLLILFVLIVLGISALVYYCSDECGRRANSIVMFIGLFGVFSIISLIIVGVSFDRSVGLRRRLTAIEQYSYSIKLYAEKGVSKYQDRIADLISELRCEVALYNSILVSKTAYNNNLFFGLFIVAPPKGHKVLKMEDLI
jgi:hypothetical protein